MTTNSVPDPAIDESIALIVDERGITELIHFTTNRGLLGMLGNGRVLSRKRLPEDRYIEHVYSPNCIDRKDVRQLDYVNLSVSRINDWMFDTSERWHQIDDLWWTVLSFDPQILTHQGVIFTTTNNIYPAVRRGTGPAGLSALFGDVVLGRYSTAHTRSLDQRASWPTDRQAEVLYPKSVPLTYLRRIYVRDGDHVDTVEGMFAGLPSAAPVPVLAAPEVFT